MPSGGGGGARTPNKHETLTRCWVMLEQRCERWANSKPALVQYFLNAAIFYQFLHTQRWSTLGESLLNYTSF